MTCSQPNQWALVVSPCPTDRQRYPLGPGLGSPEIWDALAQLAQDPEVEQIVLFGSRARGDARRDSDLDLLIRDAATTSHWAGSRWHVLGHIHREGVPLNAA